MALGGSWKSPEARTSQEGPPKATRQYDTPMPKLTWACLFSGSKAEAAESHFLEQHARARSLARPCWAKLLQARPCLCAGMGMLTF